MESLKRIPSPLHWFGAKSRLASQIVEHFPPHRCYCEPFGGSAAVLLAKSSSALEVYNDINEEVTDFFRVMRDPRLFRKLHQALNLTPCSRAEFMSAKEKTADPVENARRFMLRSRCFPSFALYRAGGSTGSTLRPDENVMRSGTRRSRGKAGRALVGQSFFLPL